MDLPHKKRNRGLSQTLLLMGLGAGLMYLFDPQNGTRRRALLRDKAVAMRNDAERLAENRGEDIKNRARGLVAEVAERVTAEAPTNAALAARVKSNIGRNVITNPSAVEVAANNGVVTLHGTVLASDAQKLVQHVRSIPGVKRVENQLNVHEEAGNVSSLQTGETGGTTSAKRGGGTRKTPPKRSNE